MTIVFEYDERRTAFLGEQGIRVVRFRNEQVWASIEGIVAEIVRIGREIQGGAAGVTDTDVTVLEVTAPEVTDPTPSPSP